jgi:mevalonate kinase
MLLGEHAVVYGRPCLVTAVDHRMEADVEVLSEEILELEAKDVRLEGYKKENSQLGLGEVPKAAKFVEFTVKNVIQKYNISNGFKITTKAGFKSTFGFGSSSAVTVCTAKAISELFDLGISNKELFDICYKTVLEVQGKGSGFDLAAAIWGGTILFQNKGEVVEPVNIPNFDLVVGYTGQKYGTVQVLNEVKEIEKEFPEVVAGVYDNLEYLVNKSVSLIKSEDPEILRKLGNYMNFAQGQLETINVSSIELDTIIKTAREAGSYGAKLSGAGKGDCAIALVDSSNKFQVADAVSKAGFEIIDVKVGAEGVRVV